MLLSNVRRLRENSLQRLIPSAVQRDRPADKADEAACILLEEVDGKLLAKEQN